MLCQLAGQHDPWAVTPIPPRFPMSGIAQAEMPHSGQGQAPQLRRYQRMRVPDARLETKHLKRRTERLGQHSAAIGGVTSPTPARL